MGKTLYEKIMKGDKEDAISSIVEVDENNIEEIENWTDSEFRSIVIKSLSLLAKEIIPKYDNHAEIYEQPIHIKIEECLRVMVQINKEEINELVNLTDDRDFRKITLGFLKTIAIAIRPEYINEEDLNEEEDEN